MVRAPLHPVGVARSAVGMPVHERHGLEEVLADPIQHLNPFPEIVADSFVFSFPAACHARTTANTQPK